MSEIGLAVKEEAVLEEAYMAGVGVSIKMPTGNMQDFPPPPTTQAEAIRPPLRKAFEYSRSVLCLPFFKTDL